MININVTGFLTEFTDGKHQIVLNSSAETVGEALAELWQMYVGLRDRVVNEQGQIRLHVNVFLNDENVRRQKALATPLRDGDEITILPSVSGG
ncbi:MAG TPA: ubiquitin-like small modifier protein 1 [Pyrinomonadaceae bacterium]|nr:ubiquitin-like small modifier protein 1 [Pyrinomonadaceae bacterium]